MTDIQKTLSITEALNERINMLTEDLEKYEADLKKVKAANNAIKSKRKLMVICSVISWLLVGLFVMVIIYSSSTNEDNSTGILVLLILFFFGGIIFNSAKYQYKVDNDTVAELEKMIDEISEKLEQAKTEKRDMVLQFEKEIKINQSKETITEDYNYEENDTKECPMCAEFVKFKAKICRYCGYKFEETNSIWINKLEINIKISYEE